MGTALDYARDRLGKPLGALGFSWAGRSFPFRKTAGFPAHSAMWAPTSKGKALCGGTKRGKKEEGRGGTLYLLLNFCFYNTLCKCLQNGLSAG